MAIADLLEDFPSTLDATRYRQNIANVWQLRKSKLNTNALHRYPMSRGSGTHVSPAGRRILGTSRSDKEGSGIARKQNHFIMCIIY